MSRPASLRRLRLAKVSRHSFRTRLTGTRYEREHGAVAVMTAIILSAILIGISALVVDTGVLFTERRQAQNAADAAALSVAQSCAESTTGCTPNVTGNPQQWATDNAKDSMAGITVTQVCGTDGLGTCPTGDTSKLPDCPTLTTTPAHYAEVHTVATNEVHAFKIRPGDGNDPAACSRVAWGAPKSFTIPAPMAFSMCDWEAMINSVGYAPTPPYASPIPSSIRSHEVAIVVNDPGQTTDSNGCYRWAGHVLPGGFGYLNAGGNCQLQVVDKTWIQGEPGASVPNSCKPMMGAAFGTVLKIPVFDCVSNHTLQCPLPTGGNDTWYRIAGLAAFYVTGSNLPSFNKPPLNSSTTCPSGQKCLYGWFTQDVLSGIDELGDSSTPDYGVKAIQMIG